MTPATTIIMAGILIGGSTILRLKSQNDGATWENTESLVTGQPWVLHGGQYMETLVFSYLLIVALLIVAMFAPTLAQGLAYMGMVGAFVLNGSAVVRLGAPAK